MAVVSRDGVVAVLMKDDAKQVAAVAKAKLLMKVFENVFSCQLCGGQAVLRVLKKVYLWSLVVQ